MDKNNIIEELLGNNLSKLSTLKMKRVINCFGYYLSTRKEHLYNLDFYIEEVNGFINVLSRIKKKQTLIISIYNRAYEFFKKEMKTFGIFDFKYNRFTVILDDLYQFHVEFNDEIEVSELEKYEDINNAFNINEVEKEEIVARIMFENKISPIRCNLKAEEFKIENEEIDMMLEDSLKHIVKIMKNEEK